MHRVVADNIVFGGANPVTAMPGGWIIRGVLTDGSAKRPDDS